MIKAAFFDIDGTLVSFKTHQVSEGTIRAFDMLHARGVRTFISTGRPYCLLPQMPLQFDGYVTMNGGYCFMGERVCYKNPIPQGDTDRWVRYAMERDLCTMIFTEHGMFVNKLDDPMGVAISEEVKIDIPPLLATERMLGMEAYQFIAVMEPEEDARVLELLPHCRLPRWHEHFSDLINCNNSKAVGIESIIAPLGIKPEECIAFGDGANDIEMLQYCGIGVAMGNAKDEVKQAANYVTTSVDEEGVLHAVETLGES